MSAGDGYTTSRDTRLTFVCWLLPAFNIDAVIMNLDRSCHPATMGSLERRIALQEAGVPCMVYEAPYLDPREINLSEIGSRLETFMETLGLRKA